jgi:hypothetical protein
MHMRHTAKLGLLGFIIACNGGSGTDPTGDPGSSSSSATGTTSATPTTGDPPPTSSTADPSTTTPDPTTGEAATTSDDTTIGDTTTGDPGACGAIVTFADGKQPSAELHVAPDGADAPTCGPADAPCASIEFAAGLAAPGTAVRIHSGTYAPDQFISDLAGTADAPIWIGGAPGETPPVISGGSEALHLSRARYLVVHDLEVVGATGNGINIDDGGAVDDPEATRFVVFQNLEIHQIGEGGNQDCLKMSGVNDYWVLDSEFYQCGAGGSAIDHVGCHHGLIAGNHFHDNGGNAVQCKGGSEDIEIRGNRMVDTGQRAVNMGGSTGFEFFRPPLQNGTPNAEARDIRVIANTIVGGETPLAFVGCVDCAALNNTIVRPHNWLLSHPAGDRHHQRIRVLAGLERPVRQQPRRVRPRRHLDLCEHRRRHGARYLHLHEQPLVRGRRPRPVRPIRRPPHPRDRRARRGGPAARRPRRRRLSPHPRQPRRRLRDRLRRALGRPRPPSATTTRRAAAPSKCPDSPRVSGSRSD